MTDRKPPVPPLPPELESELALLTTSERTDLARAWEAAAPFGELGPSDDVIRKWRPSMWDAVRRETEPHAGPVASVVDGDTQERARRDRPRGAVERPRYGLRREHPPRPRGLRLVVSGVLAAAAVIALLIALPSLRGQTVTVTAPRGEQVAVVLPDGSQVELNAGATLNHPRRFGGAERRVHLEGEAFFDVASDGRPFTVETFNAEVTVLGTSFNVRAWPEESAARTEVAVTSGRVRVSGGYEATNVVLEAGDFGVVGRDAASPTRSEAGHISGATAWRKRGFVMTNRTVGVVLEEVQRRFAVDVSVEDAAVLADTISVIVPAPADADVLLQDVAQYLGASVERTPQGYVIRNR